MSSNRYFNSKPYVPGSLSEINDLLGSMILRAPTFIDRSGVFPDRSIESVFAELHGGLGITRKKLGEERYAKLIDLAAQAKGFFADDPDDTNGQTDQGRALLFEIEDVLSEARRSRVTAKLSDADGEITGD